MLKLLAFATSGIDGLLIPGRLHSSHPQCEGFVRSQTVRARRHRQSDHERGAAQWIHRHPWSFQWALLLAGSGGQAHADNQIREAMSCCRSSSGRKLFYRMLSASAPAHHGGSPCEALDRHSWSLEHRLRGFRCTSAHDLVVYPGPTSCKCAARFGPWSKLRG